MSLSNVRKSFIGTGLIPFVDANASLCACNCGLVRNEGRTGLSVYNVMPQFTQFTRNERFGFKNKLKTTFKV
ncbi:hypothetical protein L596_002387 [Steinernema carpocapsae]|uniref:Uncharacterized protein n=1 Tax=Steinernema carpocapsae TaxID=34508 RepID=A0A4V6I7Q1_STECR|nr:hypothetical protein L596_002387 [Steinernema carpocapsae]